MNALNVHNLCKKPARRAAKFFEVKMFGVGEKVKNKHWYVCINTTPITLWRPFWTIRIPPPTRIDLLMFFLLNSKRVISPPILTFLENYKDYKSITIHSVSEFLNLRIFLWSFRDEANFHIFWLPPGSSRTWVLIYYVETVPNLAHLGQVGEKSASGDINFRIVNDIFSIPTSVLKTCI